MKRVPIRDDLYGGLRTAARRKDVLITDLVEHILATWLCDRITAADGDWDSRDAVGRTYGSRGRVATGGGGSGGDG